MRRLKKKEPKFFCESCGSEVPRNSKICTTCGRFFASVKCPKCGRIGDNDDFKKGCPTCGYAINPDSNKKRDASTIQFFNPAQDDSSKKNNFFSFESMLGKDKGNSSKYESALPLWVYIITVGILMGLVVLLYSCL